MKLVMIIASLIAANLASVAHAMDPFFVGEVVVDDSNDEASDENPLVANPVNQPVQVHAELEYQVEYKGQLKVYRVRNENAVWTEPLKTDTEWSWYHSSILSSGEEARMEYSEFLERCIALNPYLKRGKVRQALKEGRKPEHGCYPPSRVDVEGVSLPRKLARLKSFVRLADVRADGYVLGYKPSTGVFKYIMKDFAEPAFCRCID